MTSKNTEIVVGVFVALGFAALLMLAMKVSNLAEFTGDGGYEIVAHFDNIGGLKVRSPVTMSGVRVGRVSDIRYDEKLYQAQVTIAIQPEFARIPTDTSASIYTAGLLGEQYVALLPGGAEDFLEGGSVIRLTQSAVVLEELIGQFLYSQGQSRTEKGGNPF
jgi:phospholipid/cholesterol/gamma-HCH transport system substrate-binding protein